MELKEHLFDERGLVERKYRIFPNELEDNILILFHATSLSNLEAIQNYGLQPGIKVGKTLETISYSQTSTMALTHWISIREENQTGIVLALKFENNNEIFEAEGSLYSNELEVQPTIECICKIPSSYKHN